MQSILNLIRWKNLLLIAVIQLLIKYALFEPFGVIMTLNWFGFALLIVATLCIAAAGNIVNDIYDLEADRINKPDKVIIGKTISEKNAFNAFIVLNIIGVAIGFYLANLVEKSSFSIVFVGISIILYMYATSLKQILIIKNLIISILVAMSLIIVALFDLLPSITPQNRETQLLIFKILFDYALFAFSINLIREIVKDLQDIDGDHKTGLNTLPIAIGNERTTKIAFVLLVFFTCGLIYYFQAETKTQFKHVSNILKLTMLLGMLSLLIYPFILR